MTLSNSLLSYQDCLEVMDSALADTHGVRVRFDTESAALHFRARCHKARTIQREKNCKIFEIDHPQYGSSVYDELILRLREAGDGWYILLVRMTAHTLKVESLTEAEDLAPAPERPAPDVPAIVEAIKLNRRL